MTFLILKLGTKTKFNNEMKNNSIANTFILQTLLLYYSKNYCDYPYYSVLKLTRYQCSGMWWQDTVDLA